LQVASVKLESDLRTARIDLEGRSTRRWPAGHRPADALRAGAAGRSRPAARAVRRRPAHRDGHGRRPRGSARRAPPRRRRRGPRPRGAAASATACSIGSSGGGGCRAPRGARVRRRHAAGRTAPARPGGRYRAPLRRMTPRKLSSSTVDLSGRLVGRVFDVPRACPPRNRQVAGLAKLDYAADRGAAWLSRPTPGAGERVAWRRYARRRRQIWEEGGGPVAGGCGLKDQKSVLGTLASRARRSRPSGVIHGGCSVADRSVSRARRT